MPADREAMLIEAVGELRKYELTVIKGFRAAYKLFLRDLAVILDGRPHLSALRERLSAPLIRLQSRLYRTVIAITPQVLAAGIQQAQWELQSRFAEAPTQPAIPDDWYDWYSASVDNALRRYTGQQRRQIEQLTHRATVEGWDIPKLSRELQREIGHDVYWRAERVARTEVMRLFNLGHAGTLYNEPIVAGFTYAVILDARTSVICRSLAGRWVRRDQLVRVPPFHPNCRTLLLPIFEDETATLKPEDSLTPTQQAAMARQFGGIPLPVLSAWQAGRQAARAAAADAAGATAPPLDDIGPVDDSMLPEPLYQTPLASRGWEWYRDAGRWVREKYFPDWDELVDTDEATLGDRLRRLYRTGTMERGVFQIQAKNTRQKKAVERRLDAIMRVIPERWLRAVRNEGVDINIVVDRTVDRAYYRYSDKSVYIGPRDSSETVLHETVHAVQFALRERQFNRPWEELHQARTAGEAQVALSSLYEGFGPNEVARVDRYVHVYIGKEYNITWGRDMPLEMVTMCVSGVFEGYLTQLDKKATSEHVTTPFFQALAKRDLELLDLTLGVLCFWR